jgi:SAM-dependent methyltransferase
MARLPTDSRAGVAAAYSAAGEAWHAGPTRIYDVMAREQLACAQVPLDGAVVLDLGAGTGAASRAAAGAGARSVVAVDVAVGMLLVDRDRRPPAVIGDALQLPFADGVFDTVVAAFSLNHLDDPVAALAEASRVTRGGGWVLSSSYAADDTHPVKGIVDETGDHFVGVVSGMAADGLMCEALGAADLLIGFGLDPRVSPGRNAAYAELVARFRTEPAFRVQVEEVTFGQGLPLAGPVSPASSMASPHKGRVAAPRQMQRRPDRLRSPVAYCT